MRVFDAMNAEPSRFLVAAPESDRLRNSLDHARDIVELYRKALAQKV